MACGNIRSRALDDLMIEEYTEESVKETLDGPEMAAMPEATIRKSGVLC